MSPGCPARGETESSESRTRIAEALYGVVTAGVRRRRRDMGLTSLSTLLTLDWSGPRRVTDLSTAEGVTQPSMTSFVNRLERSGLVERRADPTDKRVALVALTASGSDYLHTRKQAGAEAFIRLIDKMSPDEVEALAAAVKALDHFNNLDQERGHQAARSSHGRSAEISP